MRHKMEEFRKVRQEYLRDCRLEYGYRPRARAKAIGSSQGAGFISAIFGCMLMLAIFATYDFHSFKLLLDILSGFSFKDILHAVFDPLRDLWGDPWKNVF